MKISNLYSSEEYKSKVLDLLCRNNHFISLINPAPSQCPELDILDVLHGGTWIIDGKEWKEQGHVFDYDFMDDTVIQERTFVFADTDIGKIRNGIFTDFNLYIYVFTAKDLVSLTETSKPTAQQVMEMGYFATPSHGNRIGALCDCIDSILNGNDSFNSLGGLKPDPESHLSFYTPGKKYYGKCLKYNITNYNPGGGESGI